MPAQASFGISEREYFDPDGESFTVEVGEIVIDTIMNVEVALNDDIPGRRDAQISFMKRLCRLMDEDAILDKLMKDLKRQQDDFYAGKFPKKPK
jgi:hypothetical protein